MGLIEWAKSSISNWQGTKFGRWVSKRWEISHYCILLIVLLIGIWCYSIPLLPSSCPLEGTVLLDIPHAALRRCTEQKPINCLQVKNGFVARDGNLESFITIRSALNTCACQGPITLLNKYSDEATIINNLHNEILRNRINQDCSKITTQRVKRLELSNSGIDRQSDILKTASFVSVKFIVYAGNIDFGTFGHTFVSSMMDNFKLQIVQLPETHPKHLINLYRLEPEEISLSSMSEVIVIPMDAKDAVCKCQTYQPSFVDWFCDIPFLGRSCSSPFGERCSVSFREIGRGPGLGLSKSKPNIIASILLCH